MKSKISDAVTKVISGSDLVLCVLDARYIYDTRNAPIENKIKEQNKKVLYVLNKADLVQNIDQKELNKLYPRVLVSCLTRKGVNELRSRIKIICRTISKEPPFYIGVVGYPNTGKSSVINLIIGRKDVAKTSPQSGFTKGIQSLKLSDEIYLLDSPGIIPESERFSEITKLAKIGVKTFDNVQDPDMVVYELMKLNPGVFEKFYEIDAKGDSEKLIDELGKKRNLLLTRYRIDTDRAARMILRDWQKGLIKV